MHARPIGLPPKRLAARRKQGTRREWLTIIAQHHQVPGQRTRGWPWGPASASPSDLSSETSCSGSSSAPLPAWRSVSPWTTKGSGPGLRDMTSCEGRHPAIRVAHQRRSGGGAAKTHAPNLVLGDPRAGVHGKHAGVDGVCPRAAEVPMRNVPASRPTSSGNRARPRRGTPQSIRKVSCAES
jgi:hypothetical protein